MDAGFGLEQLRLKEIIVKSSQKGQKELFMPIDGYLSALFRRFQSVLNCIINAIIQDV